MNKNINKTTAATKVQKITIKRNTAMAAANNLTGEHCWTNIRFNVVNLSTGEQLLETKWGKVAKGDRVVDLLPYYAAAAALAECKRINGKITGVVNEILNNKELTAAAAAVREARAEYSAAAAEFSKMKKSIFEYIGGLATAAASRRFYDSATDDEITAAAEMVKKCDIVISTYGGVDIETFVSIYYKPLVDGMTDAPAGDEFAAAATKRNAAATALKQAKADELRASDAWALSYYN